jgi:hypothetical protein
MCWTFLECFNVRGIARGKTAIGPQGRRVERRALKPRAFFLKTSPRGPQRHARAPLRTPFPSSRDLASSLWSAASSLRTIESSLRTAERSLGCAQSSPRTAHGSLGSAHGSPRTAQQALRTAHGSLRSASHPQWTAPQSPGTMQKTDGVAGSVAVPCSDCHGRAPHGHSRDARAPRRRPTPLRSKARGSQSTATARARAHAPLDSATRPIHVQELAHDRILPRQLPARSGH